MFGYNSITMVKITLQLNTALYFLQNIVMKAIK